MDRKPFATLEQLREIERTYPMPFHLYDEKGIRENAVRLKQASSWNRGYKEYFAAKAMPNPLLLNIPKNMGCGTDCLSMTEFMMSRVCGPSGSDIMFLSSDAPPEEFAYAEKLGAIINLGDITHIQCLEETLGYILETISCRFNPGGLFKINNDITDNPGDSKYGMTAEQIGQAFKILKERGAKHFDTHTFSAGNTVTNEYYLTLAKILFELAVKLKEETGVYITFVNLSGGIEIPYRPDQEPNGILAVGGGVRRVYEEILAPTGMDNVVLCTELGCFMMGPHGALVTEAVHERHTYKEYVGVDTCAMNPMRPAIYGAYCHIMVMDRENEPCIRMYDVVGSPCESNDKLTINRMLPEIKKGNPLFIHDVGAHGFAMGYNYNGKLKSAELLLEEDGTVEMICRVETPEDCFATSDFCDMLRNID